MSAAKGQGTQGYVMAPKPVHPTAVRTHGLFGIPYVRQHMMVDDYWTPSSLTEQFKGMADLLEKRKIFNDLENKANRIRYALENRKLKRQCRDGRTKLHMSLFGENTKKIRNFLIHHKEMQRLYQKMPVDMVVDNINQRTFVMRKERDRLRYRLNQMKKVYESKLIERATLQNRVKYENEFVLEEDLKSRQFRKKIENSNVRLKAVKTINTTYKKMIQVLRHDGIFYEPILRSLSKDIEDQSNFIKHILYLGMPAIAKFKVLSAEYRTMEDKTRKNLQSKQQWVAAFRKSAYRRSGSANVKQHQVVVDEETPAKVKRYVRETDSMLALKNELEQIETTLKQVKFSTLCSQAREIYPRMKSQVDNNKILHKKIENDILGREILETKKQRAEVLLSVEKHHLIQSDIDRNNLVVTLQDQIDNEDKIEVDTIAYMKNRADVYVLLRFTLWNLHEILRHVDREPKDVRKTYPTSYLKLPLLKFEMLNMRACPPEIYDENIDSLMHLVKRKVLKLIKAYRADVKLEDINRYREEYHELFLECMDDEITEGGRASKKVDEEEEDDYAKHGDQAVPKNQQAVPGRGIIKWQSAKIVEEHSKKDD